MKSIGENGDRLVKTIFEQTNADSLSDQQLIIISYFCEENYLQRLDDRISGCQFFKKGRVLYNADLTKIAENMKSVTSTHSTPERRFEYDDKLADEVSLLDGEELDSVRTTVQQLESTDRESLQRKLDESELFTRVASGNYVINKHINSMDGYRLCAVAAFTLNVILGGLSTAIGILGVIELIRHLLTRERADKWYRSPVSAGIMRGFEIATILGIFIIAGYGLLVVVS